MMTLDELNEIEKELKRLRNVFDSNYNFHESIQLDSRIHREYIDNGLKKALDEFDYLRQMMEQALNNFD